MSASPTGMPRRHLLAAALAAGTAPAWLRVAHGADVPRFGLGVASGHPRPNGMVLWTRLTGDALPERVDVAWEVAHDEAFTRIAARGTDVAEADAAHSVHAEPRGLDPAREYWYRFRALGQQSAAGRTRTAPAPDAPVDALRFAIASCQRWDHGHFAAWRDAVAGDPHLIVFLGDYIYEYASPASARLRAHEGGLVRTLADYRARYAQYKSDPQLQAAHACAPWLMVWDDHEVDNDYAALQSQDLRADFQAQRAAAYRAYWEHMPFPKAARPRDASMRIHDRLDWGQLARFHLLDDRQYRDPQACPRPGRGGSNVVPRADCAALADPRRTLLGTEQERWLEAGWDTQRPWNLLAQQTLMSRFSWGSLPSQASVWTDGWDGYPAARQRLLEGIAQRKLPGAVVLGGDVHTHYVADVKADFDAPSSPTLATEFCGTSISSRSIDQARIDAALPFNPHIHAGLGERRGTIRFELTARSLQADLRGVDDASDPASTARSLGRWAVEHGRPGAQRG